MAPWLARAVMVTIFCAIAAVQFTDVIWTQLPLHALAIAVDVVTVVVLFALTLTVTSAQAGHWPAWRRLATLAVEAALTYLPLLVLHSQWAGMGGFLAGSALVLLEGWAGWAVLAAAMAGAVLVSMSFRLAPSLVVYWVAATWIDASMVYGLARLVQIVRFVHATRAELAQLAIVRERMRFARDLHDLLGYSLSAITLKAELTKRLVTSNPSRARDELADVIDTARQALADVRTVASGYRSISLTKEASSVAALLATAGIEARMDVACGALDERVDTVLATVLREAVTNLLRHSSARNCVIEGCRDGRGARLRVANDGVPRSAASGRPGGGLGNLATRLKAVGGQLTVGIGDDGWFSVLAEVPSAGPEHDGQLSGTLKAGSARSARVKEGEA
jgi:two-component system, NarL family, sensor histidine kinase DesK